MTSPTEIDFQLLATPRQSLPNFQFANRAFTLEAFANGQPLTHFNKPFTMLINYDTSDLIGAGIDDPRQLNLVFWDGSAWKSVLPCAGCSIDTVNRRVTVVLDHFTEFALVAPNARKVYLPLTRR